jgi:hypothetical protein
MAKDYKTIVKIRIDKNRKKWLSDLIAAFIVLIVIAAIASIVYFLRLGADVWIGK